MTRLQKSLILLLVGAVLTLLGCMTLAGPQVRLVAQKIVTELAMPCSLVWLGLCTLTFHLFRHGKRHIATLALLVLGIHTLATSPIVATMLMWTLEQRFSHSLPLQEEKFDAIIVLGGGTVEGRNGEAQLDDSGDRVMLAARMYHAGLTDKILCTGQRNMLISRDRWGPAEEATILLVSLDIPPDRLEQLDGMNTAQEMRSLAKQLQPDARIGIITSAWHMPRALRLARSQGLHLVPLPADFHTPPTIRPTVLDLIPSADAGRAVRAVLKEYLARIVGR